jgi:membrane-associated protein
VRTFAPTVAGAADMTYRRFAAYNVIGGIGWVVSMTLTGYFLGQMFGAALERNIHILVAVVIFLSLLPAIIAWLRERRKASKPSDPGSSATTTTVSTISAATPAAEPTE